MAKTTTEDLIIDELQEILKGPYIWTAEFLARKFWDFDSEQQAKFFNILANIKHAADNAGNVYSFDFHSMKEHIKKSGKELIDNLKLHTD